MQNDCEGNITINELGFLDREKEKISDRIDAFAKAMKLKMFEKVDEGYYGWDEIEGRSLIEQFYFEHVERSRNDPVQYVDVANFCMMLWNIDIKDREFRQTYSDMRKGMGKEGY